MKIIKEIYMGQFREIAEIILQGLNKLVDESKSEREIYEGRINEDRPIFRKHQGELDDWLRDRRGQQSEKLSIDELGDIISDFFGHSVNFYPSDQKGACCDLAIFLSISGTRFSKIIKRKKELYSFKGIMDAFSKHMQGDCVGITRQCVIITDSWEPDVWENYKSRIKQIKKSAEVEIYLISDPHLSEIELY